MKTRLLYLSISEGDKKKFEEINSECIIYYAFERNQGIKFLKSRYPDIVILNEKLLNDWGKEVLEYLGSSITGAKLVIEFESLTKGTLINLVNNFHISKIIEINSRDYLNNIRELIQSSINENGKDKIISDLKNRIKQYDYILQQNLIES